MKDAVYLDYNATTPIKPEVIALMQDVLGSVGNASSVHGFGRNARRRVETAREQVAVLAGVHANQVIFTSGATESNNAVLKHFAGKRILVAATEHNSVRNCLGDGGVDHPAGRPVLERLEGDALARLLTQNADEEGR